MLIVAVAVACGDDEDGVVNGRYVNDVFTELDETYDVKYGANTPLVGFESDLFLDIYEPQGDNNTSRATLVLAHGGAFVSGTKTQIREICRSYARKGYVVASIAYRLINDPAVSDSVAFSEGVIMSIADMRAAIRFLRDNAQNSNDYGIDPTNMFVGGVSAGAIVANHAAFFDSGDAVPDYIQTHLDNHGGIEGNSNDINVSSEVKGVIAFSGSIVRDNWMDNNADIPIYMVHEEFDQVVPCNREATDIFPFPILAYGACEMETKANELGINHEFEFIAGSDSHVGYFSDETQSQELIDASALFISNAID